MILYRYGALAWFWRVLIFGALVAGCACVALGWRSAAPVLYIIAATLLAPALFFGLTVATHIDRSDDGAMMVRSLLFTRRTIQREQLGAPRVRQYAQSSDVGQVYAPRVWVPVKGGLPVYIDLLARIPDRGTFASWWRVPMREMPGRRS